MRRNKIIAVIIWIVIAVFVPMILVAGGIFLVEKGVLTIDFIEKIVWPWIRIIIGSIIILILFYDYRSIRTKKKKFGKVKYILKRKDKIKQVIGFIVMVISFLILAIILTEGFKKVDSNIIVLLYFPTPLILLFGYHNLEKEGISDGGVCYWGDIFTWDKVLRYNFKGDKLILTIGKRSFGKIEEYEIHFIVNGSQKIEIKEFLSEKMN